MVHEDRKKKERAKNVIRIEWEVNPAYKRDSKKIGYNALLMVLHREWILALKEHDM